MKKLIAGLAVAIVGLSGAVSAQDSTVPAYVKYQGDYASLPGYVGQVIPDPDRSRNPLEVARERDICNGARVLGANWRSDIVLAVRCPAGAVPGAGAGAGAAGAGLPGALTGTALTTGAAVGLVAVVTVLVVATGGDGGGTTTTTTTLSGGACISC